MKSEWLARCLALIFFGLAASIPLIFKDRTHAPGTVSAVELRGRMPENGGWSLQDLSVKVGEPLKLRLTSDDVLHGFAVGLENFPAVDIRPGEWTETTLQFERPGKYTFYCTRWCGPNHWRMRGSIIVHGDGEIPVDASPPRFVQLGIDLDAPHRAGVWPTTPPSATRGAALASRIPAELLSSEVYERSSKADLWQQLRARPDLADLGETELWDMVAYIWSTHSTAGQLQKGEQLYRSNCAACHGETGSGDGVMMPVQTSSGGNLDTPSMPVENPDFRDPQRMYGASPALLEGKLLRGGMGTSMPAWGSILPAEDLQALLTYLYSLSEVNNPY